MRQLIPAVTPSAVSGESVVVPLLFSASLSSPTVAGDLHGSQDSGRCVLRPSAMAGGAATTNSEG